MSRQSRNGLENMKAETAKELGIDLTEKDGRRLTSVESGRIGGRMVKKMIEEYRRQNDQSPMK